MALTIITSTIPPAYFPSLQSGVKLANLPETVGRWLITARTRDDVNALLAIDRIR